MRLRQMRQNCMRSRKKPKLTMILELLRNSRNISVKI